MKWMVPTSKMLEAIVTMMDTFTCCWVEARVYWMKTASSGDPIWLGMSASILYALLIIFPVSELTKKWLLVT